MSTLPPISSSRVCITGVGLLSPLGVSAEETWRNVAAGRDGFGPMPAIESRLPEGATGGQAADLPTDYRSDLPREARGLRWAIEAALRDAGAEPSFTVPSARRRVMLGTTLHGMRAGGRFLRTDNPRELGVFLANATAALALRGLGLTGGIATTCSACSSSLGAIALGVTLLQAGQADLVVAGGYDTISEYAWAGFQALRLVSPGALRPFCRGRLGMKLAESYATVVLEREDDAHRRGARPEAVIAGWGESADAHHLTQPHPQGEGAVRAMRQALGRAGLTPDQLDLVVAHATGTTDNDASEYRALADLFGPALPNVPVVGFKSHLGHTLGGAGAAELILAVMALRAGAIPACANVVAEEVEFESLRVTAGDTRPAAVRNTLNTSLGFGGANTCIVLSRPSATATPKNGASDRAPSFVRREVWITGIGVALPGIVGVESLVRAAKEPVEPPWVRPRRPLDDAELGDLINARRARRLSGYVKFTLATLALALRDAGLVDRPEVISHAAAILASTHGAATFCSEYYTQVVREGVAAANPVLFAEGVPNAAAAHVSTTLGVRGACQTIIGARTAGLDALALAALRVAGGAADVVLVSANEESHAAIDRAYRAFGLLAPNDAPAGRHDQAGFFSTHGGAALVVESAEHARARGVLPRGVVRGSASAFGPAGRAARTVAAVLAELGSPSCVIGSANGTWVDRAEARGLRRASPEARTGGTYELCGEAFSATPLIGVLLALATGELPGAGGPAERFAALCTDWTGAVSAVDVERGRPAPL